MSLVIEYEQYSCQTQPGRVATIDDYPKRIHVRAYREGSEYFIGISNAKPEGDKNGPGYCELGFYLTENELPTNQGFMGENIELRKRTE